MANHPFITAGEHCIHIAVIGTMIVKKCSTYKDMKEYTFTMIDGSVIKGLTGWGEVAKWRKQMREYKGDSA